MENGSPKLQEDNRKTQRSFLDPSERSAEFNEEFRPEAIPLAVVPRRCLEGIDLGLRANLESKHLPTGKAMLYSLDDLVPRPSLLRGSLMCCEALFQKGLLPLLKGYLVDIRRDVIPKRLHIVDLVFDRKRVKPRGRQRQGM
jgi:hypothetical protein